MTLGRERYEFVLPRNWFLKRNKSFIIIYERIYIRIAFFTQTDPRLWTEAQAAHWFWWAYREFSVPEPPPTPLLRRVVCGGTQFQKFAANPNTTIVGRSSGQIVRERVRRGRRRLRSNVNKSPTCSSNEDDRDNNGGGTDNKEPPDVDGVDDDDDDDIVDDNNDDDDDEPFDELISSSSGNQKPLYARKGRHLCNMGRERFVAEAPPFLGDILWEHLEMMQRGK